MHRDAGQDEPKAVPEMIRSSIGPSSVGGTMLVGVDAPLGVADRERPKRLRKPIDFEEIEETVLIGVKGLESTCWAAKLRSEPWREEGLDGVGVS
jgi:hypothetical protein